MFERRKMRKLVERLEVNPNLDTLLDDYTSDDSGFTWTIHARECTPLTCAKVVDLLWDLIGSSRSARSYKQIIWAIDYQGPGHGPTVAEEERIGQWGFWFSKPGGDQTMFKVSARLHYRSGTLGTVNVTVIRSSNDEFRAVVSHYSQMRDLNSKPWTERSFW
jgi:hypothetical protein